ncbi:MAG: prolyl oligopeptidase family serine peptidase [Planctomycetaceae bacterium]|nr:prolyl oligopeptidase family serine peptidase [Planctomycetaceae bacterium]
MKAFGLSLVFAVVALSLSFEAECQAQKKSAAAKAERIQDLDANDDGKTSRDEVSATVWKRIAAHDTNADGVLSGEELEGLKGKQSETRRPGGATSAFEVREFQASNKQTLRYSLFTTKNVAAGAKLPLVLCLHGAGGNTEAAKVLASPEQQRQHPCFIVAPACEARKSRWVIGTFRNKPDQRAVEPELMEALDKLLRDSAIDPDRVYLTGQSMGGLGTWGLIVAHPDRFAAAVPVCGTWEPNDAAKIAKVPVWAFHGAKDPTVPVEGSRRMIEAMKAAGGSPRYTEYPDVAHGSWGAAYATTEMWDWMFQQRRQSVTSAKN